MKRGPHIIKSSEIKYQNPWISVREDKIVRSNGQAGLYGIVSYSPGVVTVALNKKNEVYLVKEFLYAANKEAPCLPGGGVDAGQYPLEAAKRELQEEAGVAASRWVSLGHIEPYPMIVEGKQYLFLAQEAKIVTKHEEEFTLMSVSFDEAVAMVMRSEITHAASCIAILKAKATLDLL